MSVELIDTHTHLDFPDFDADRQAKDKIYSKWGGFLDDLVFDPTFACWNFRSVNRYY